ncbi:MAG: hypothetical protein ACREVI_04495 [Steroidobacteraceae bacterium]
MTGRKFPAVTIAIPLGCCAAVDALKGVRILATRAPLLPLPSCSTPDECRCRYKKYTDRREDEQGRRFKYGSVRSAWYAGAQRRSSQGRRGAD